MRRIMREVERVRPRLMQQWKDIHG
jgi:hypothetical protein